MAMYLMWTPNSQNCANGSACTIPVPLGSLSWNMSGCTINTLIPNNNNLTTWEMTGCQYPKTANQETVTFSPGSAYPVWCDQNGCNVYPGPTTCP